MKNRCIATLAISAGAVAVLAFCVWSPDRQEGGSYFALEWFSTKSKSSKPRTGHSTTPVEDRSWGIRLAEVSTRRVGSLDGPEAHQAHEEEPDDRQPEDASAVEDNVPLVVYREAGEPNNFVASGWMGDLRAIQLDEACKIRPHSGETSARITYKPNSRLSNGWSGVYWLNELDNWGAQPGRRVGHATALVFHARGARGGERAEFKIGGVNRRPHHSASFPHQDSFGPLSTGVVTLSREWRRYRISLASVDESIHLIGGFCWVATRWQNPEGATIFVDDILIERTPGRN